MHLTSHFIERDREEAFLARHGKPITVREGVRVFETGAVIVEDEFSGQLVFHEPNDNDPMGKIRIQRDFYFHGLKLMESQFHNLKEWPPSQEVLDKLLELQNLITCYRQKIEEIDAQLHNTPEAQRAAEKARQVQAVEQAMAEQQRRLKEKIDAVTID